MASKSPSVSKRQSASVGVSRRQSACWRITLSSDAAATAQRRRGVQPRLQAPQPSSSRAWGNPPMTRHVSL